MKNRINNTKTVPIKAVNDFEISNFGNNSELIEPTPFNDKQVTTLEGVRKRR